MPSKVKSHPIRAFTGKVELNSACKMESLRARCSPSHYSFMQHAVTLGRAQPDFNSSLEEVGDGDKGNSILVGCTPQ